MEGSFWLGAGLAIAASTFLNVGKGLQKWKVAVLGAKTKVLEPPHRGDFLIWVGGVGLTTIATLLYSLALKFSDKPSTVSALNGIGLIGLIIFAWAVLHERIGPREMLGAALIVGGTTLMGAFDEPSAAVDPALGRMAACVAVLLLLYAPLALYSWRAKRFHGLVFGSLAGILIGTTMVLGDIALLTANDDLIGQLRGPWVYIALSVGVIALAVTQLAFWRATAMVVVPTTNSFIIFTPLLLQYFAFGTVLSVMQYAAVVVIIGGVVPLTMGESRMS